MPTLSVKVLGAKGISEGKGFFIKLSAGNDKGVKTAKTTTKSNAPTFDDAPFSITIGNPDSDKLLVGLYQTALPKEKRLGEAEIVLSALTKGEELTTWYRGEKGVEFHLSLTAQDFGKESKKAATPSTPAKKTKKSEKALDGAAAGPSHLPPMPPAEKLESLFNELLTELGMTPDVAAGMKLLPPANKWELICQQRLVEKERETSTGSLEQKPEFWIDKIKADPVPDTLERLALRLGHELVGWIKDFASLGGISQLVNLLSKNLGNKKKKKGEDSEDKTKIAAGVIACLGKVMNTTVGMDLAIRTDNVVLKLKEALNDKATDASTKTTIAQLLSVIALMPDGHTALLDALSKLRDTAGERSRFASLVTKVTETEDVEFKTTLLTLINSITNSPADIDTRVTIRKELADLKFNDALDALRKIDSEDLELQISVFDEEREHDEQLLKKRFAHVEGVKLDDVNDVFSALQDIAKQSNTVSYLRDVLVNLVALNPASEITPAQWILAAKTVRQISYQKKAGEVNFQAVIKQVANETKDLLPLRKRVEELEEQQTRTRKELKTRLIEIQEKTDAIEKLKEEVKNASSSGVAAGDAELKQKLQVAETELAAARQEARKATDRAIAAEKAANEAKSSVAVAAPASTQTVTSADPELKAEIAQLKSENEKLQSEVATLRASSTSSGGDASAGGPPPPPPPGGDGGPPPPPPPPGGMGGPPPPPPPPGGDGGPPPPPPPPGMGGPPGPPPPPGMGGPPGPPPPPGMGGPPPPPGMGGPPPPGPPGLKAGAPKKRPEVKPKQKVRGLQWTKLPPAKVNGTFFGDLPMELGGFALDFDAIEGRFAQVTKPKEANDGSETPKKKEGPVTILDPKTSQNLGIFLNSFKQFKHSQIADGIRNLDDKMFSSSQIAGLITMLPPPEEIANVKEYVTGGGDPTKLGPAEQFSLEISEVTSLQPRLKAFSYISTFESKKCDIKPDIESVTNACKQIRDSKKLTKVLEIVLHIGNFLNAGTNNGQAFGFKLNTLGKLGDAKTTDNKSNLLTVIVEMLEEKDKELLEFGKEIDTVDAAVRVNMGMLQGSIGTLTKEFENVVKRSLESVERNDNDKFHTKVEEFIKSAEEDIKKMNDDFGKMEADYESLVKFFAEDPKAMGPDEFFVFFKSFNEAVAECRKKLEQARVAAEKEAKRAQAKATGGAKKAGAPAAGIPPGPAKGKLFGGFVPGVGGLKKTGAAAAVVDDNLGLMKAGNVFKARREEAPAEGESPQEAPAESPREPEAAQ